MLHLILQKSLISVPLHRSLKLHLPRESPFPGTISSFPLAYNRVFPPADSSKSLQMLKRLRQKNGKSTLLMFLKLSGRLSTSAGDKPAPARFHWEFPEQKQKQDISLV